MTPRPTARLGPYELVSLLGAGGMGEVYRARDTRLERTVAVKVVALADGDANASSRLERFRREALAVSRLSHPYICSLLDVGEQDGQPFLVMEYVEGETLATRLQQGRLPLERALRHGRQIAAALDAAHREGIVHRDLKPANVMLTRDGVKLLDFGLAKLQAQPEDALAASGTADLTTEGTVLGTVPYMAPETLEGKASDARTDIFALGVVLYEMVCGRRPFVGDSKARVMSAILEQDPPAPSLVQPLAPPVLDHVIRRCLAKDPDERWQTAGDVGIALGWVQEGGSAAGLPAPVARRRDRRARLVAAVAGAMAGIAVTGLAAWRWLRPELPPARPTLRLELTLNPRALTNGGLRALALSPDASRLAYVTGSRDDHRLAVRTLSQESSVVLDGTEGAEHPFFSPDGRWVAFFADGSLKKVAVEGGGAPVRLCATDGSGGFWEAGDTLLFSGGRGHGLLRVAASGGTPREVTRLDAAQGETTHTYPWPLPDGGLLFTALTSRGADALTVVQDARSGARRTLFPGFDARFLPGGYLVYTFSRAVRAVRFDLGRHQTVDAPVTMVDVTTYTLYPIAVADASANGTLIYAPRDQAPRHLLWVDPTGERPLPIQAGLYETPRLSPSGERVAVKLGDDIWLIDLRRPTLTRLTVAPGWNDTPAWTPDGKRIAYGCHRRGVYHGVCWLPADGSGTEEELFTRPNYTSVAGFSPDGATLLFTDNTMETGHDLGTYTLADRAVRPLLASAFNERSPAVSPDGRWIAYSSDDSGSRQVYVQPFPALGARWQASTDGGDEPVWSRDGRQLFYRRKDDMLAVAVTAAPEFRAGLPRTLFSGRYVSFVQRPDTDYDVAPDGRRFLVVKRDSTQEAPLVMIVDWAQELRRRLPWTPASP